MEVFTKINKLYNDKGYLEKYSLDIWVTVITCIVFFIAFSYYHIMNHIQPIKADWPNQRCKPNIIPFAGLINKPTNQSAYEFTQDNFTYCTQNILTDTANMAMEPFYYITDILANLYEMLSDAINSIRAESDVIRTSLESIISDIMNRILNIATPLVGMVVQMNSTMNKNTGVIGTSLYFLSGTMDLFSSGVMFLLDILIDSLTMFSAALVPLLSIAWAVPLVWPVIIADLILMTIVYVFAAIIKIIAQDAFDLSAPALPGIPSCFAGEVEIPMLIGVKQIKNIKVGDILRDGAVVTATMKLSSYNQEIYVLDGNKVTGNHEVFHHTMGWIPVDKHPDSIKCVDFIDPFVWCINTTTKTIKINKYTYSDWDNLDDDDLTKLKRVAPNITRETVHQYFYCGFKSESMVTMKNGELVSLREIRINDSLKNDSRVCGIVYLANKMHLITTSGTFYCNKTLIHDYNACLEKYL